MRIILPVFMALAIVTLAGCGPRKSGNDMAFSSLSPLGASKTIDISLSRPKLESAAMQGDTINTLRVVEVFRRGEQETNGLPEYRLFDIQKGSVFEMLGWQNADVVQAANDHVIYEPDGLKIYALQVLPKLPEGSIRLVRSGIPVAINYKITQ